MKRLKALRTLHMPSATYAPTITHYSGLSVLTGDRSIKIVLKGDIFELEDNKVNEYILRGWAVLCEAAQ